jgi:hypothetical protein
MLGQLCPLGTGAFDLLLNEDELAAAQDLLIDEGEGMMAGYEYGYGDGSMTPGRTPGYMTPSRTPFMTPNRCVVGTGCVGLLLVKVFRTIQSCKSACALCECTEWCDGAYWCQCIECCGRRPCCEEGLQHHNRI